MNLSSSTETMGFSVTPQLGKETLDLCLRKRIIPIIGKVGPEMRQQTSVMIGQLLLAGAPDIAVFIDSGGGDVDAGLDIFDLIDTYPGQTTGLVFCRAASMGATILQACDKRLCAEHAEVMIHYVSRNNVSLGDLENLNGESIKKMRKHLLGLQQALYKTLAKHSNKSIFEIRKACRKESWMRPAEAQKFGLIDGVITRLEMAKWFRPDVIEKFKVNSV